MEQINKAFDIYNISLAFKLANEVTNIKTKNSIVKRLTKYDYQTCTQDLTLVEKALTLYYK